MTARADGYVVIDVEDGNSDGRWTVQFADDHPLGSRFIVTSPLGDTLWGFVSWAGEDLIFLIQDADKGVHQVAHVDGLDPDWDITPLDDEEVTADLADRLIQIIGGIS